MDNEDYFNQRNNSLRLEINSVDDAGPEQYLSVEGLADEKFERVIRIVPHGFTSHSPSGAHALGVALGARRDTLALLGGEHPNHRPKNIGEGNTAIYNADGTINKLVGKDWTLDAEGNMVVRVKSIEFIADQIFVRGNRVDITRKDKRERAIPRVATEAGLSEFVFCDIR